MSITKYCKNEATDKEVHLGRRDNDKNDGISTTLRRIKRKKEEEEVDVILTNTAYKRMIIMFMLMITMISTRISSMKM